MCVVYVGCVWRVDDVCVLVIVEFVGWSGEIVVCGYCGVCGCVVCGDDFLM